MTTKNPNYDGLVKKLRTKEGKTIATVKAVEQGLDVGSDLILQSEIFQK